MILEVEQQKPGKSLERKTRKILIVDDEPHIVEVIAMNLEHEGFAVSGASSGCEALEKLARELPDLIVLDVMMPELDGFETLERIREISDLPVIMLSVLEEERDKVKGLELGADEYVIKPYSVRELIARIKALLRRVEIPSPFPKDEIVVDEDLSFCFSCHRVVVRGKEVHLRPTEFRLLYHLVNNAGRLLTHESLLRRVWGHQYRDEAHYLWLYITYLRQKIEIEPKKPKYIFSERGVGYRFKEIVSRSSSASNLPSVC
jgi:two-component system KDP operon response regulator KdpE